MRRFLAQIAVQGAPAILAATMSDVVAETRRRRAPGPAWAAAVCVALAVAFSLHAWLATRTKSATFDEPIHALSAWLVVNRGDFRLNPEHPPLWKYLAGLPLRGVPLNLDLDAPAAREPLSIIEREWPWGVDVIYRTPGNDGVALVARARVSMAALPMLLALVVARWAWAIAGPAAAVVATLLVSLDPNLLAHGALVTNDLAATLVFTLAAMLTWCLGQRFTWPRAIAWALVCALGVGVKFTCVLLAPMAGVPLIAWALFPRAFDADGFPVGVRTGRNACATRRIAVVLALGGACVALAWVALWPAYGFRSAPTAGGDRFDRGSLRALDGFYAVADAARRDGRTVDAAGARASAATREPRGVTRALFWLGDRRLVPDAFAAGVTFARSRGTARPAFLLGEHVPFGSPLYFPVAIAVKTPTATLAAIALAAVACGATIVRATRADRAARWTLACLAVPPAIYLAAAMASSLNIGVRHVLPIFPPLYVALGVAASHAIARWRRAPIVVGAIAIATAVEALAAFPNYLPFFNAPAGGARGGLRLLSDSNLDWGQDLPALADWHRLWRRANPRAPFYLAYFGTAEPRAYGIDYVNATPGYPFARAAPTDAYARDGGVLAISATFLQGVNVDARDRPLLAALRTLPPLDVLNGSIYIYRVPPDVARR